MIGAAEGIRGVDPATWLRIAAGKSGELLGRAASAGARVAGCDPTGATHYHLYGYHQGILLQAAFWYIGAATAVRSPPLLDAVFYCSVAGALAAGDLATVGSDVAARLSYMLLGWLSPAIVGFFRALGARPVDRKGRLTLLGLSALAALESLPPLAYPYAQAEEQSWFDFWHDGVRLTLVAAFLVATGRLRWAYRRAPVGARRRIRLIAMGTALGFTPLFLLALVPETLGGPVYLPYDLAFPWLLVCPGALAYARFRHRLVRAEAVLARALVLYLNGVVAIGLFIAVTWLGTGLGLLRLTGGLAAGSQRLSFGVIVSVTLVCAVVPLQPTLRQTVRWMLYGQEIPGERIQAELSRSLTQLLDREKLRRFLTEDLPAAMGFSSATVFLRGPEDGLVWIEGAGRADDCSEALHSSACCALIDYLATSGEPRTTEEMRRDLASGKLNPGSAVILVGKPNGLWLPLAFSGEPRGALLIEARLGDTFFTAEDRRVLGMLAQRVGVAAYNIRLVEEVRARGEEVARAHRRVLCAREQERLRLARELHDPPLQQMLGVGRLLEVLGSRQTSNDATAELSVEALRLEDLRGEILTVVKVLREVTSELRPAWIRELGLTASLRSYFGQDAWGGTEAPRLTLDLEESETDLPEGIAIALFRIAQEAVRNAVIHAEAEQVELRLRFATGEVVLTVRDDGRGFNPPPRFGPLVETGHFGLVGMAERAELVSGSLSIRSRPDHGTRIIA